MKSVRLVNISKKFGDRRVLDELDLFIEEGIFFVLLGPSGCGKTTLIRIIAGLEKASSGRVMLGEQDITDLPAYQRRVNTVFQRQGLFPHLTVFENIAYGLTVKGLSRDQIQEKVKKQIGIVNLLGLENKYPETLSGGQMQRVALARSLVMEPDVLLFDESMSALDTRLKERMLIECVNLQAELKATFIYITHDRKEALTIADKIAIMDFDGNIEQIGTPFEVYERPASRFVANFVGDVNIVGGVVEEFDGKIIRLKTDLGIITSGVTTATSPIRNGLKVFACIRPERITVGYKKVDGYENVIRGKVTSALFSGVYMRYEISTEVGIQILVFEDNFEFEEDEEVFVHFKGCDTVVLES